MYTHLSNSHNFFQRYAWYCDCLGRWWKTETQKTLLGDAPTRSTSIILSTVSNWRRWEYHQFFQVLQSLSQECPQCQCKCMIYENFCNLKLEALGHSYDRYKSHILFGKYHSTCLLFAYLSHCLWCIYTWSLP